MKRVLLVDDDEIINFLNQKLLERFEPVEVRTALNGQQAMDLMGHSTNPFIPDVIFLDLNMPIMDGFEFLKLFSQSDFPDKEKIKIVIVTSSQNEKDIARAKALGIIDYLSKPVSGEQLQAAIGL